MYFVHLAREIKPAVFINRLCHAFVIRLKLLYRMGGNRDSNTVIYSLVESNGKLFVCWDRLRKEDGQSIYCWYYGSAAQEDGSFGDWGLVDFIDQGRVAVHDESGFVPRNNEIGRAHV